MTMTNLVGRIGTVFVYLIYALFYWPMRDGQQRKRFEKKKEKIPFPVGHRVRSIPLNVPPSG